MPSENEAEAFAPARKIDVAYDGRIQCETEDGKVQRSSQLSAAEG
jgi:hypothetical protein